MESCLANHQRGQNGGPEGGDLTSRRLRSPVSHEGADCAQFGRSPPVISAIAGNRPQYGRGRRSGCLDSGGFLPGRSDMLVQRQRQPAFRTIFRACDPNCSGCGGRQRGAATGIQRRGMKAGSWPKTMIRDGNRLASLSVAASPRRQSPAPRTRFAIHTRPRRLIRANWGSSAHNLRFSVKSSRTTPQPPGRQGR